MKNALLYKDEALGFFDSRVQCFHKDVGDLIFFAQFNLNLNL